MLRGIPDCISSDLLKALMDMGHGDVLVIADHYYPPYSKSPHAVSIQCKGTTAGQMVDAILKLFPLDDFYCKHPVEHMIPDADSGVALKQSQAWDEVEKAVIDHGYSKDCVGTIERTKFYEKAKGAFLTVCTSETREYGCFILQKGVK